MRGVNQTRKAVVGVDVDGNHQVQTQQCEVREVVLRQAFAAKMCMHATQTAESIYSDADALEVWQFNAAVVSDHHVFNVATAIYERADLAPGVVRHLRKLSGKLRAHDLMRGDTSGVKLFQPANLIWFQTGGISDYVFDNSIPPCTRLVKTRDQNEKALKRGPILFCGRLKLQEERCEQWVSDARKMLSILLGDFASLIRLSITIIYWQAPGYRRRANLAIVLGRLRGGL